MGYFKHHVFICTNQRDAGEQCCNATGGSDLFAYAKDKVGNMKLNGPGAIRINKAGCLGRCDQGPVVVVYPEGTWYTCIDKEDLDEIIESHLVKGQPVDRLKI